MLSSSYAQLSLCSAQLSLCSAFAQHSSAYAQLSFCSAYAQLSLAFAQLSFWLAKKITTYNGFPKPPQHWCSTATNRPCELALELLGSPPPPTPLEQDSFSSNPLNHCPEPESDNSRDPNICSAKARSQLKRDASHDFSSSFV